MHERLFKKRNSNVKHPRSPNMPKNTNKILILVLIAIKPFFFVAYISILELKFILLSTIVLKFQIFTVTPKFLKLLAISDMLYI